MLNTINDTTILDSKGFSEKVKIYKIFVRVFDKKPSSIFAIYFKRLYLYLPR